MLYDDCFREPELPTPQRIFTELHELDNLVMVRKQDVRLGISLLELDAAIEVLKWVVAAGAMVQECEQVLDELERVKVMGARIDISEQLLEDWASKSNYALNPAVDVISRMLHEAYQHSAKEIGLQLPKSLYREWDFIPSRYKRALKGAVRLTMLQVISNSRPKQFPSL